jgi:hypothetical protein
MDTDRDMYMDINKDMDKDMDRGRDTDRRRDMDRDTIYYDYYALLFFTVKRQHLNQIPE